MALTQISTQGIKDGTITGSDLATNVDLVDNQKLRLGTGNDLHIFHDGTNSFISDTGSGALRIVGSQLLVRNAADNENMIVANQNGSVDLYYDNDLHFATTSQGCKTNGDLSIQGDNGAEQALFDVSDGSLKFVDNIKAKFGSGDDLQIYHDSTNSRIHSPSHNLYIRAGGIFGVFNGAGSETMLKATVDGAFEAYYDNSKKFETTSDGVKISGAEGVEAILTFEPDEGDNASDKFRFRASDSAGFFLENGSSNDTSIKANFNGSVELYHANSKKLNTNANGVHITDTLTFANTGDSVLLADDQKVSCGNGGDLKIYHDGSNSFISDAGTGGLKILGSAVYIKNVNDHDMVEALSGGAVSLFHNNSKKFETSSTGVTVTGQIISDGLQMGDNERAKFGSHDDLQIYHSTANNIIECGNGMQLHINKGDTENMAKFIPDGAVELYHDNSKKFETTSVGASIPDSGNQTASSAHTTGALFCNLIRPVTANNNSYTGTYFMNRNAVGEGIKAVGIVETGLRVGNFTSDLSATEKIKLTYDGHIEIKDNGKLKIGTSDDLQIYHDSANSYIQNLTGALRIYNHVLDVRNDTGNETILKGSANGSVELYYNNVKKLETSSVGVTMNDTVITNGEIRPASDNNHSIGRSNRRYITYFGVNGSINTSDKNEKNTIIDSDLGLDFINKLKPISYKWNKDDGKTHYGLIAQDLEETLTSLGKTIADFGGIYKEDDSPMGLGYSELIAPLIKAIQELSTEVAALKAA